MRHAPRSVSAADDCLWCDGAVNVPAELSAELAGLTVDLAIGAADVVRAGSADHGPVFAKSDAVDLVTRVDRDTERWLVEQIVRARPDDGVLGEEGGERAGTSGVRWVLDPIDGTVNFVLGLPQYAVSVAVEWRGQVVAGAVCNPVTGELYRAVAGGGAYLDAGPRTVALHGPRTVELSRAVVGTGFGYDRSRRSRQATVVAGLLGQVADVRRLGAASLDLCAVASGRLDAYFEAGLSVWDYSAGALIAAQAGCVVTGLRGQPASEQIVVAAGPGLTESLVTVLEQLGADAVLDGGP